MAADNTKSRVTFYYLVAKDLGKLGTPLTISAVNSQ